MKIYGPYTRKDGRKHIVKYKNGKRTTQSYPRYLMEQHLGRPLLDTEEVDHTDEDYTNDDINNLQLLTKIENVRKNIIHTDKKPEIFEGICPICSTPFTKEMRHVKDNQIKRGKAGPFCSRSCAGKYSTSRQRT